MLVVDPDTSLSMWVRVINLPPGIKQNTVPAITDSGLQQQLVYGVVAQVGSNPFAAIYYAHGSDDAASASTSAVHADGGVHSAMASPVTTAQQVGINTAIALTKKTYFVQLDPSSFPSYEGSLQIAIAEQNFTSLSQVPGLNWPESAFSDTFFKSLLQILGLYTGHSFVVCDAFGNGDSACFVPDPTTNNVLVQTGTAKNADNQPLPIITNTVAGGGGAGPEVTPSEGQVEYFLPPGYSGAGGVRCGYVNGVLSTCILVE